MSCQSVFHSSKILGLSVSDSQAAEDLSNMLSLAYLLSSPAVCWFYWDSKKEKRVRSTAASQQRCCLNVVKNGCKQPLFGCVCVCGCLSFIVFGWFSLCCGVFVFECEEVQTGIPCKTHARAIFKTFHCVSDENSCIHDVLTVVDPATKWLRCYLNAWMLSCMSKSVCVGCRWRLFVWPEPFLWFVTVPAWRWGASSSSISIPKHSSFLQSFMRGCQGEKKWKQLII